MTDLERALPTTRQEWAELITRQWQESVESVIKTGVALREAKAQLAHGTFGLLFERKEVPFSDRTGQRLISVADAFESYLNTTHVSVLPPHWGTLYELSKVPSDVLEASIESGRVYSEMERREVRELLPVASDGEPEPRTPDVSPPTELRILIPIGEELWGSLSEADREEVQKAASDAATRAVVEFFEARA